MTESDGEAVRDLRLRLQGKLDEFRRYRADPECGMYHELPALVAVVELAAELVIALAARDADLP